MAPAHGEQGLYVVKEKCMNAKLFDVNNRFLEVGSKLRAVATRLQAATGFSRELLEVEQSVLLQQQQSLVEELGSVAF